MRKSSSIRAPDDGVQVEIITYAPTAYFHCTHCEVAWREMGVSNRPHEEQLESSLPEELTREYRALSDWVQALITAHGESVQIRVIDAASIEGFYASLKYRVRRYPAVIVNRKARFQGSPMLTAAREEIARQVSSEAAVV
jgi:hypothetical protein